VQLYTSKSYENRRDELVNPPERDGDGMKRSSSTENLQKHVLSPRLVEAISKTTQVVWANTKKQEGLIGRSDIRLQTAVGMPVGVDCHGNMCIVVMFSPNNIQSTDEAMEYLQSVSQSATSASIPCLLPVFDPKTTGIRNALMPVSSDDEHHRQQHMHMLQVSLGEGVTARYVSLENYHDHIASENQFGPDLHSHELESAPKETFSIPMLPSFTDIEGNVTPDENIDVFDEASYGIWTTIMESLQDDNIVDPSENIDPLYGTPTGPSHVTSDLSLQVMLPKCDMSLARKERLEEFCSAFLAMSVFDLADVWVPCTQPGYTDCLRHVLSVSSNVDSEGLHYFKAMSEHALIKLWTGAVGRAYSSGNPVWSTNPHVFFDAGRADAFQKSNIQTVLSVPVYSDNHTLPACIVSCYSLVRSGSVPFVLKFVQQALKLLWGGLDRVAPHGSVGENLWKGVAPADLGEMAADIEMQQHFLSKKRPHHFITETGLMSFPPANDPHTQLLASRLQSIRFPDGQTIDIPLQLTDDIARSPRPSPEFTVETLQQAVAHAVRAVGSVERFDSAPANFMSTKRQHLALPTPIGTIGMPLAQPRGFPTKVVSSATLSTSQPTNLCHLGITVPQPSNPIMRNSAVVFMGHHQNMLQRSVPEPVLPVQQQFDNFSFSNTFGMHLMDANFNSQKPRQPSPLSEMSEYDNDPSLHVEYDEETDEGPKLCRIQGCGVLAAPRRPYCETHSGNRLCEHSSCSKCAQGSTRFCIAHGGGRRCTFAGCDKGARDKFFCAAHGGGKRCKLDGCNKSAVGGSQLCTAHGGGRRCAVDGCDKSAQSSTQFCVKHGGGKKCEHEGCEKVARGRTQYCAAHGGGIRCRLEGCNRVAIGRMQLCRAHGGASSRSEKGKNQQSPTTTNLNPVMDPNQVKQHPYVQMQGLSMNFTGRV
jgi:hypothetical protein